MTSKRTIIIGLLALTALVLAGCGAEGPAGPQGEQGPPGESPVVGCSDCHDDTTMLLAIQEDWAESNHATGANVGGTFGYASGRADCTACHSGEGFQAMIAAGVAPGENETGVSNPTRVTCRTCHEIHTTYTGADWTLATSDAVTLIASGETFDGGAGNLCATCHQSRSEMNEAVDGLVEVSEHWGPHHGVESVFLLGLGGAGGIEGSPGAHSTMVADTCVSCHLGESSSHSFEPSVAACTGCHMDAEDFDIGGLQTEIEELGEQVLALLEAKGMYHDGHAVEGSYPEAEAAAMWNYIYVIEEDGSLGVHNPAFAKALLEAALDALQ
jgi:hypothetical protein